MDITAAEWNQRFPVGTPVRYHPILAEQIERGDVKFLDILRTRGELWVMVPSNIPEAARAILDNIRFDIEAAERGAFPLSFA